MNSTRRQFIQKDFSFSRNLQDFTKQNLSPSSTNDSNSPRDCCHTFAKPCIRQNKEKSQLCKKFMETGFCPYQKKCKFAHGSHQLRKNSQVNSKYKTKQCGVFINQGYCLYGDRCNFIHKQEFYLQKLQLIDLGFLEVKAGVRSQSRLLALLQ